MKRLGPYRALDLRFSVRAHRSLADAIEASMADLRCDDAPADTLTVRRSRRATWDLTWGRSAHAPDQVADDEGEALREMFTSVSLAAASSAARHDAVLHGGAVTIDGRGVAFIGGPESNTSVLTAAATLANHGYLADQVTAIDGAGRVRGFHRPITMAGSDASALGTTVPLRVGTRTALEHDVQLGDIFVVSHGPPESPEPLDPADALVELTNHAIAPDGFDTRMFRRLESIARGVPIYRLPHVDPTEALGLVRRIQDHGA